MVLESSTNELKGRGYLRPITSLGGNRYEKTTRVQVSIMEISPGLFTAFHEPEPKYLPPLWSAQVHPEGQLYFLREGALRVVTDAYLYSATTAETVCRWVEAVEALLSTAGVVVGTTFELFLQPEENGCAYYLVDHATCTQFWLEKYNTENLGLQCFTSASQLKIALEELYWTHVEYFPTHLEGASAHKIEELCSIFSHGLCDQMTSPVSTFFFTAQQCSVALRLLQGCKGLNNGYTTCIIARLFSEINRNRILTYYGQETARLCRDQHVAYPPEPKCCWISTAMAALTFQVSNIHRARLEDNFVDHIVYVHRWNQLMGDCLKEWRASAIGALSGLILQLPLLMLRSTFPMLGPTSAVFLGTALGCSVFLDHKYRPMERLACTEALNYLERIHSPRYGFKFVAFSFSLPRALQLWGSVLLLINNLSVVDEYLGRRTALGFIIFSLLVILALCGPTSGRFSVSWNKCQHFFRQRSENAGIQIV
ncbi:hypothetical protein C8F04DRAFT_657661 [Mycena alexandri]|uniref:Uncharacterized protein n=1 Tax=Mycena alexandri TaxID=1745969 RepID=A0AAD6X1J5_9AGAR|nr:hypothetical protein C8F04DRAFT_657661 [Mycena alexandri]